MRLEAFAVGSWQRGSLEVAAAVGGGGTCTVQLFTLGH